VFNQLRDDLSRVGLSFVEYANVGEVGGWRGWVESPQGVVAFVGEDGSLVWQAPGTPEIELSNAEILENMMIGASRAIDEWEQRTKSED
jgi:hypothetical protein